MRTELFKNRSLLIATKHQKEKVIAPIFESAMQVHCFVPNDYDTDTFGTFSGEIERPSDPITVLKMKCKKALEQYGYDMGIASEGSFGPHPQIPFAQANEEFMIFMDLKNQLEIMVGSLSTETNFSSALIETEGDLHFFAKRVHFPEHAIILKSAEKNGNACIKGITNYDDLVKGYHTLKQQYHQVIAETDMRAHLNPTRMKHLQQVAQKLIDKIQQTCPTCSFPGFDVKEVIRGLPCNLCNFPTNGVLKYIMQCKHCNYQEEKKLPNNKETEEPLYCGFCNP